MCLLLLEDKCQWIDYDWTTDQLSDFAPGLQSWDTAVAINRTNKNNIVVSYGVIDEATRYILLLLSDQFHLMVVKHGR